MFFEKICPLKKNNAISTFFLIIFILLNITSYIFAQTNTMSPELKTLKYQSEKKYPAMAATSCCMPGFGNIYAGSPKLGGALLGLTFIGGPILGYFVYQGDIGIDPETGKQSELGVKLISGIVLTMIITVPVAIVSSYIQISEHNNRLKLKYLSYNYNNVEDRHKICFNFNF